MTPAATARAIAAAHTALGADDDPLDLDSFTLVAIAQDLEDALGLTVRPSDLTAANFGTLAALMAYAEGRTSSPP